MYGTDICPLCRQQGAAVQSPASMVLNDTPCLAHLVQCNRCGRFHLGHDLFEHISSDVVFKDERYLLSGITKQAEVSYRGGQFFAILTEDQARKLLSSPSVPQDHESRAMLLLRHISIRANGRVGGRPLKFHPASAYPLCFARDAGEFREHVMYLHERGYVKKASTGSLEHVSLTVAGSAALAEYGEAQGVRDRAFVAIWADNSMEPVYRDGIVPALKETGWKDDCVNWRKRTENLDKAIIEGIRECGLIVADLTENRPCVYYEAGYAHALGKDVILTVRKDFWDETRNRQFDTHKWRHVVWEDVEDLRRKLVESIRDSGLDRRSTDTPRAGADGAAQVRPSP